MKRGAPNHPKMYALAEALGIRRPLAVGYVELLIHGTAQYAPQGDIGKFSDKRIAAMVDYPGKPEKLIAGLLQTGWIDRDSSARLVLHDWHQHADRTTLQWLSRQSKTAIVPDHKDTAELCTQGELQERTPPIPIPNTYISNTNTDPTPAHASAPPKDADAAPTSQKLSKTTQREPSRADVWFDEEFWPNYWRKVNRAEALKTWRKHATSEEIKNTIVAAVRAHAPGYCSREPQFRPHASSWLNARRYLEPFEDATPTMALVHQHQPRLSVEESKRAQVLAATRLAMGVNHQ